MRNLEELNEDNKSGVDPARKNKIQLAPIQNAPNARKIKPGVMTGKNDEDNFKIDFGIKSSQKHENEPETS